MDVENINADSDSGIGGRENAGSAESVMREGTLIDWRGAENAGQSKEKPDTGADVYREGLKKDWRGLQVSEQSEDSAKTGENGQTLRDGSPRS